MNIIELTGTTAADGSLTLTADSASIGYLEKIVYDWSNGDTGADIVVTNVDGAATTAIMTKANLGVADVTFLPRSLANKVADGSAFTDVAERIFVTGKFKIVVASGGNAKVVRFLITTNEN